MRRTPPLFRSLLLGAAIAVLPSLGSAQQAATQGLSGDLQEVVVTATRSEVELSKVPLSVTAFTQAQLDAAGVKSVADLAEATPGINYVSANYGGFEQSNVSIRGIDSRNGGATTGIYIDDTPVQQYRTLQAFNGQPFPKMFDLERVEVLKGPQGTLFGGSSEGGAIRFITPTPSLDQYSGYAKTEVGQTENGAMSYEGGAAFGGPIAQDTLGFRVSAWYRRDGGYVDRTSWQTGDTTSDANHQESVVVRAALRWKPSDFLEITPAIFYQDLRRADTSFYWTQLSDPRDGRLVTGNTLAQPSTDRTTLPSIKIEAQLPHSLLFTVNSSYFDRQADGTLDVTNYFPSAFGVGVFPTEPPNFYWASDVATTQRGVTEELRLQTTDPDARVRWLVGFFYQSLTQRDGEFDRAPLLSELPGAVGPFDDPNTAGVITVHNQSSIYGSVDFRLTDTLTLTAGVRAEHSRVDTSTFFTGALYYGATTQTNGTQSENPVTPKVGLSWQPNVDTLVYANFATGYRDGGVNPPVFENCQSTVALSDTYRSDRTRSFEVGTKDKFADGRIQVEASIYDTVWSRVQTSVYLPCGISYVFDGGQATVKGIEFVLRGRIIDGLTASASVSYTDGKYDDTVSDGFKNLVIAGTSIGDPGTGNALAPWAVVAVLDYKRDILGHDSFIRVQDSFRSHDNGPFTSHDPSAAGYNPTLPADPSTNEIGLKLGSHFSSLEATFFVDNLTDSQPTLRLQHFYSSSPLYFASTFRPRTYGLSLNYKF